MKLLSMSELREVQLGILRHVDAFCRQRDIRYYLAWGTLLGAVRHRGYIPWDDDIDIMMQRPDYERFCSTFPAFAQGTHFSVDSHKITAGWPFAYAKVSDNRTVVREDSDITVPFGVNIDIFPVDECPGGLFAKTVQLLKLRLYQTVLTLKSTTPRDGRAPHKTFVLKVAKPIVRRIPTETLVERLTQCALARSSKGGDVGVRVAYVDWRVGRDALGTPVELAFEGGSYLAPNDSDRVLRAMYGDYMRLPPESERESTHVFTAFRLDA